MRLSPLAVVVLSACGRIGFDAQLESDAADDSTVIDAAVLDAAPDLDAAPMVASGPFDPPVRVEELVVPGSEHDDPTLPGDTLEIYFKRDLGLAIGADIYFSTRAAVSEPWSTPARSDALSSTGRDESPEISNDGLTLRFSSDRDGEIDIYRSTRPNRAAPWSTPVVEPDLSSLERDYAPAADRDDLHIAMTRFNAGADLFMSSRSDTADAWGTVVEIAELNTNRYEADAAFGEAGLHLFYTSDDGMGGDGRQVVSARRSAYDQPFVPDAPLVGINGNDDDEDPWVSEDLSTLYFVRDIAGVKNIFVATRPLGP